jgi:DMSO/TMAO reductase YedYZ molybdopterin-dependent catalytic subunit
MPTTRRIVTATPENSETPLEGIRSWVTPTRLFFVRNHFDTPALDAVTWRLTVEGCVERPITLTLDELSALPQRSVLGTVECAGNGRSFLSQVVAGVQWGAGAIAHAEWTGVPLHLVLERAGVKSTAREVVFEGADSGTEPDHPDLMHFARSLPLDKALHGDTLLALEMNGEPLELNHGFPVRLLVPGWYGVASVKWLTRINVVEHAFVGYFQTTKYTVKRRTESGTETVPVQAMAVKSAIVRPRPNESLQPGTQRVFGIAWAGEDQVERVEVSTNGGQSWDQAELLGPHAPYSWTLWEYAWPVNQPGRYELLSRATSNRGETQPLEHNPLHGGYMIHFSRPIEVSVIAAETKPPAGAESETLLYDMNAFAVANAAVPLDVHMQFSYGAGI